jgi:hypothetical protein
LVVAAGLKCDFTPIEGATEALEDPNSPVGSMYDLNYAYKFAKLRE